MCFIGIFSPIYKKNHSPGGGVFGKIYIPVPCCLKIHALMPVPGISGKLGILK